MQTGGNGGARRRPRERKQQIVVQARKFFVQHGFPQVTMAMVAESLGITAGALYRHYANKAALLEEVFVLSFDHLRTPLSAAQDAETMFREALELMADRPYSAELWRNEAVHLPPAFRHEVREQLRGWVQPFIELSEKTRPELEPGQQAMLGWAMQTVLTCPSDASAGLSQERRQALLSELMFAVLRAPLTPSGEPVHEREPVLTVHSTRERLLLAAIRLFGEQGYQATSMASIGAAAGVTGPNLYSHFENKAALLRAAYQRGAHAAWLLMDQTLAEASGPRDALARAAASHAKLPRLWNQVRLGAMNDEESKAFARQESAEYVGEWVRLVQQANPGMEKPEAYLRVVTAFTLVDDLSRTASVNRETGYAHSLPALMLALLVADAA